MQMSEENIIKIKILLDEYKIKTLSDLESSLMRTRFNHESSDSSTGNSRGICLSLSVFSFYIPECRIFVEIHRKFYSNFSIKHFAKKLHDKYLDDTNKDKKKLGLSSITGYLSCKYCDDSKYSTIKNEVLKDILCNALEVKLDMDVVFNQKIKDVEKLALNEVTIEDLEYEVNRGKKDKAMTEEELNKLYNLIYVTRSQFQNNLAESNNIEGSDKFKMQLALNAFKRNLVEESFSLVESLIDSEEYKIV